MMTLPHRIQIAQVLTLATALSLALLVGCSETPVPSPSTTPVEATSGPSKTAKRGAVSKAAAQTPGSGDYEDKPGVRARGR